MGDRSGVRSAPRRSATRAAAFRLIAVSVAVASPGALVAACESQHASSCSGPFLLFTVHGRTLTEQDCAGQYADLGPVKVKLGDRITAKIPRAFSVSDVRLPVSGNAAVLRPDGTGVGRRRVFTAVGTGTTSLNITTRACADGASLPVPSLSPTAPGSPAANEPICRTLTVTVTG
ncbi:hypothetical protein NE236_30090 [Actinoallomurus purpureus]|uniref:hypothetical protein n=1 Tax=Actinoallomurus purpureus TaxID=478114 RepID=UPI0020920AFB|nr:hypothetical protein [Actinoallomurus purpureus]MCO6009229.1 hypothetical protein [Actinoallomurus purpureus]